MINNFRDLHKIIDGGGPNNDPTPNEGQNFYAGDWLLAQNNKITKIGRPNEYLTKYNPDRDPLGHHPVVLTQHLNSMFNDILQPILVLPRSTSPNQLRKGIPHDPHNHLSIDQSCCCNKKASISRIRWQVKPDQCNQENLRCSEPEKSPIWQLIDQYRAA